MLLLKHFAMLTAMIVVCSSAIVYSQAPVAFIPPYSSPLQSVPYSGPGSSSVPSSVAATSYPGTGNLYSSNSGLINSPAGSQPGFFPVSNTQLQQVFPLVIDPNVEPFAHSLTEVLLASPILNAIGDFVITDSYSLLYKISIILLERDNDLDTSLAKLAAEAGRDVGVISRDLYYNSITHMFSKILSLNNKLTQETTVTYPRTILSYVEDYGIKNGIFDIESVLKAVTNGVLDFGTSIGVNNIPNLTLAFHLFVQELIALSNGTEI